MTESHPSHHTDSLLAGPRCKEGFRFRAVPPCVQVPSGLLNTSRPFSISSTSREALGSTTELPYLGISIGNFMDAHFGCSRIANPNVFAASITVSAATREPHIS